MASHNFTITQESVNRSFTITQDGESRIFTINTGVGPAGESVTVDQTIIDGSTNAVSGNAVFDGLALKAPIANPTFTGIVTAPRITGRCDGLEVLCKAGLAINAGQVVYVTGASGSNIIIGLAQANAEPTSSKTIGISESTLANNATGYAITEGLMTVSISAPSAIEGDPIWLSSTTAGGMVFGLANKPSAPNHIVYLGVVTRKTGNTVVEIYVKIQNGAELDELADVAITSPVAGQALMRGASIWENRSIVSADISDATSAATPDVIVKRDSQGRAFFASTSNNAVTGTSTDGNGISGVSTNGNGLVGTSTNGVGAFISSTSGTGGTIQSSTGTGARTRTISGTNHHEFGTISGDDRSFVRRVLGLFGWHRGSFVQTLGSPATLTADSAIELPDIASGTVALTSDARFTDERVPTAAGLTSKFGTNKATIVDGDKVTILDSAASDAPKHVLWSLIVSTLTTAFNALYVGLTGNQTVAGDKTFSGATLFTSTTRPTSGGTGTPAATSLMTRDDVDLRSIQAGWRALPISFAVAPQGCVIVDSGNTAAAVNVLNYSNNTYPLAILSCAGDGRSQISYDRRHRVSFDLFISNASGGSDGWVVCGETYNKSTVTNPDKKSFGIRITSSGVALWVHDGTTLTVAASSSSPAAEIICSIYLEYWNGTLSGTLNGVAMASATGGPSGQGTVNATAISFQAKTGATNERSRFGVMFPKSITTTS